jgi:hypothetical protein
LKSERKRLSKAQAAISKRTRQLQAARSAGDETGIVETSARLVDSLAKLQTLQSAVANAMAISF